MNLRIPFTSKTLNFSYDAVASTKRRNAPRQTIHSEDYELRAASRKKLVATALDQQRNFAIVGWMVRKHLDYVSRFTFNSQTGVDEIDERLEYLWLEWAGRRTCDIARRHNLNRIMRLFESGKVLDGDCGILEVQGGYLQGVEGNRIARPNDSTDEKISEHGLVLDAYGAVDKYCVCKRDDQTNLLVLDRMVPYNEMVFDGYFTRFDQTRGVSPLAAAINTFQDLYETLDYQLLKAKFHAMFGVFIARKGDDVQGSGFGEKDSNTGAAPTAATTKYDFELKPGLKLEGAPGDSLSTIESHTPSSEFQAFTELEIQIALLALDIPLSFFNSIKANFSGRKMDMVEYELAATSKREANQESLYEIAEWRIPQIVATDADLSSAIRAAGLTVDTLKYDFQPQTAPWIDEAAEVNAIISKVGAGLSSLTHEAKKKGRDIRDIARERGAELKLFDEEDVPLTIGQPGQNRTAATDTPSNDQKPIDNEVTNASESEMVPD